jgi:alpha-glucosidase (family GH31 glycosyl hydrolase)
MQPLYMHFERYDPQIGRMTRENTNAAMQQYMIGPNLLESSVTLPNVTERSHYLPQPQDSARQP